MTRFENLGSDQDPSFINQEVLMDYPQHMELRHALLEAVDQVSMTQIPRSFSTEIRDVELTGTPPLSMQNLLPDRYTHMSFRSVKPSSMNSPESSVTIGLKDPLTRREIAIESIDGTTEAGGEKYFDVKRYHSTNGGTLLQCNSVMMLLDGLTNDREQFASLADPRRKLSFDEIAFMIGDRLALLAPGTTQTSRTYATKDLTTSFIQRPDGSCGEYLGEKGTMLKIEKKENGLISYTLRVMAPVEVYGRTVLQSLAYSFDNQSNPLGSDAKMHFVSRDMTRGDLQKYAESVAEDFDPNYTYSQALLSLRDSA